MLLNVFGNKNPVFLVPGKEIYPVKKESILKKTVLSVVTCGLYGLVWAVQLDDASASAEEARQRDEYASMLKSFLWFITCGLYGVYWSFCLGSKVNAARYYKDMTDSSLGVLPFLLALLYIPTLGLAPLMIAQYYLNQIAEENNSTRAK